MRCFEVINIEISKYQAKHDRDVTTNWSTHGQMQTTNVKYREIVHHKQLTQLAQLILLYQGWIHSGLMQNFSVTIKPIFRAREVEVIMKLYLNDWTLLLNLREKYVAQLQRIVQRWLPASKLNNTSCSSGASSWIADMISDDDDDVKTVFFPAGLCPVMSMRSLWLHAACNAIMSILRRH